MKNTFVKSADKNELFLARKNVKIKVWNCQSDTSPAGHIIKASSKSSALPGSGSFFVSWAYEQKEYGSRQKNEKQYFCPRQKVLKLFFFEENAFKLLYPEKLFYSFFFLAISRGTLFFSLEPSCLSYASRPLCFSCFFFFFTVLLSFFFTSVNMAFKKVCSRHCFVQKKAEILQLVGDLVFSVFIFFFFSPLFAFVFFFLATEIKKLRRGRKVFLLVTSRVFVFWGSGMDDCFFLIKTSWCWRL